MSIESKIDNALKRIFENDEDTKLEEEIYTIRKQTKPHAMASKNSQIFINKLCEILEPANYLEVGIARGASFFAALYKNKGHFVGIDNWSKYSENKAHALSLYEKTKEERREEEITGDFAVEIIEQDCWNKKIVDDKLAGKKFNIFFYDGDHSYESQERILEHFAPVLADNLFLIVDDFCNEIAPVVQTATWQAIEKSKYNVIFHKILYNSDVKVGKHKKWHTGILVAYLEKNEEG